MYSALTLEYTLTMLNENSNTSTNTPRVFISYSSHDVVLRRFLQEHLQVIFPHIWSDDTFHGGEKWWHDILHEIAECDVFVFLLSPDALASLNCRAELAEAWRLQKEIVPVQIRPCPNIPNLIKSSLHIVDVLNDKICNQVTTAIRNAVNSAHSRIGETQNEPLWEEHICLPTDVMRLRILANVDPQDEENRLNTGVFVFHNDRVTINASSNVTFNGGVLWADPRGLVYDASGRLSNFNPHPQAYKVKNVPHPDSTTDGYVGSLIGWIGNGGYADPNRAFYIGDSYELEVQKSEAGFLYLAVNDAAGTYGDNQGHFDVRLQVSRTNS